MPTSKDISSYPFELLLVVERVLTSRESVPIPCGTPKEAMRLRQQAYGLRKALSTSTDHPLKDSAPQLSVRLDGNILTLCHVDVTVPEGLRKAAGNL